MHNVRLLYGMTSSRQRQNSTVPMMPVTHEQLLSTTYFRSPLYFSYEDLALWEPKWVRQQPLHHISL